jgi:hypothetical protein
LAGRPAPGAQAESPENWLYPETVAEWDDAEKQRQRESARALVGKLRSVIGSGGRAFEIPPGEYRFGDDVLPNLRLDALRDFTIDAAGATFWFNGRRRIDAVALNSCAGVTIRGLSVDFDLFPHTQGEVTAIDRQGRTIDIRIDPGFPLPDAQWTSTAGSIKAAFFGTDGRMRDFRMDWIKSIEPMGQRDFRITLVWGWIFVYESDLRPGERLVLPDRSMRHVFNLESCERVTLEDITIYSAPQMGFVETNGSGGNIYRRCRALRRPSTRRLLCTNADVFHSIHVAKGPLIEDCEFTFSGDDFVNIHGFYSTVLEQRGGSEIVVGAFFARKEWEGSELNFYDGPTMALLGARRVKRVTDITNSEWVASIRAIPAELRDQGYRADNFIGSRFYALLVELDGEVAVRKYDLVESYDQCGTGAVIRRNYFHDSISRGVVVKGQDVTIEDNRIERTALPPVLMTNDLYFWEGPTPRRIVVRGNRVVDSPASLQARLWLNGTHAAISASSSDRKGGLVRKSTGLDDIRIEGNEIVRPPVTAVFLAGARNSRIAANSIDTPAAKPPERAANAQLRAAAFAIHVAGGENVDVSGNEVENMTAWCRGPVGYNDLP